ncbi:hypothetical protein V501_00365 [Pseudogymnoascus sp. VKM F-4519 (FW-2642)]|nr:hypothetical protein V501_00365 [Pseudogymnoascus sp. VKM F-4519 (FW-2642)]
MGTASCGTTHLPANCRVLTGTYYADQLEAWNTAAPCLSSWTDGRNAFAPSKTLRISTGEDSLDTWWSLCHEKWSASVITRKGNPRPPHLNGSLLSFTRPSTLAMADEASNQRLKRCLADESADQSPTSWCQGVRTRNRPERDQRMSPKKVAEIVETLVEALNKRKRQSSRSPEWYKAMAKELNAKPSDPVATDKSDIEQKLRSGSSILVLESTPSRRSHCRALLCLRQKLTGIINIESDYQFNLKDLTGTRAGDSTHHLRL